MSGVTLGATSVAGVPKGLPTVGIDRDVIESGEVRAPLDRR